jgi:hypothetical protein
MGPYVASADEHLLARSAVLATEVKIESHKWIVSIVDDCEDSASETLVVRVHNLPSAYEFYESLKHPVRLFCAGDKSIAKDNLNETWAN